MSNLRKILRNLFYLALALLWFFGGLATFAFSIALYPKVVAAVFSIIMLGFLLIEFLKPSTGPSSDGYSYYDLERAREEGRSQGHNEGYWRGFNNGRNM